MQSEQDDWFVTREIVIVAEIYLAEFCRGNKSPGILKGYVKEHAGIAISARLFFEDLASVVHDDV
jgi:hypothetical protein